MIPRSLAIFVLVGAVAGVVSGLYLTDGGDPGEIEFVDGPSLTIIPDRTSYKTGDIITLRLVNTGSEPVFFPSTAHGMRIVQLDSIPVVSFLGGAQYVTFQPGAEHTTEWDQRRESGDLGSELVERGVYKAVSEGMTESGDTIRASAIINIL